VGAIVELETPRLILRGFRESDWDDYAQMSADPEVMRYIGTGVTLNRDEAWRSMAGRSTRSLGCTMTLPLLVAVALPQAQRQTAASEGSYP
jgi:RimJ/RimL family protein N-acetyltransferase